MKKIITLFALFFLAFQSCKKADRPTTITVKADHIFNLRMPYFDLEPTKNIRSAKYTVIVFEGNSNNVRNKRSGNLLGENTEFTIDAKVGDKVEIGIKIPEAFENTDKGCIRVLVSSGSMVATANTDDAINTATCFLK